MGKDNNLPVPDAARRDAKSQEMIRAWIAEEDLWCSLKIGHWEGMDDVEEPHAWGMLLADVARHVANAFNDLKGADRTDIMLTIRESFLQELSDPTSDHNGEFVDEGG